jgi:hypothetical protein
LPGFITWPETEKIFVPGDFSVPSAAYQSGPFSMIGGIAASVSTLLISVGEA